MTTLPFHAKLDNFHGPLDLLLFLIREREVDIMDLPIVPITDQYLETVRAMERIDPERASEFLLMAATLVEIKSRMLLPREEVDLSGIEDPRADLIGQLLAYREFKDKALDLWNLRELRQRRHGRGLVHTDDLQEDSTLEIGDLTSWDLLTTFERILAETFRGEIPTLIAYEDTPIVEHMRQVVAELVQHPGRSASFRQMVGKLARDRIQLVGLFIALLELTRLKRIRLEQTRDFADIHVLGADNLRDGETWNMDEGADPDASFSKQESPALPAEDGADVTFNLKGQAEDDHALDIDGFYKSNFRAEKSSAEAPPPTEDIEGDFTSLDVDPSWLEVIRRKIPEPVLNPGTEDLLDWKRRQTPGS
ncbi:MAG: ScpA family protein [Planctomycetota bacterium]